MTQLIDRICKKHVDCVNYPHKCTDCIRYWKLFKDDIYRKVANKKKERKNNG